MSAFLFSADITTVYRTVEAPVWLVHGTRGDFTDYRFAPRLAALRGWTVQVMETGALPYFERLAAFVDAYDAVGAQGSALATGSRYDRRFARQGRMASEQNRIEEAIAALNAQRAVLGDAVVDLAIAPLRAQLAAPTPGVADEAPVQALRQVTILFVDVVGSTALSRTLDPEDIHALMDGLLARLTVIVESHDGRVLQYAGDSLLAVFGYDGAREDDAERGRARGPRNARGSPRRRRGHRHSRGDALRQRAARWRRRRGGLDPRHRGQHRRAARAGDGTRHLAHQPRLLSAGPAIASRSRRRNRSS